MKNLVQLNTLSTCVSCKLSGFFCYTPDGADYNTCPLCTRNDFLLSTENQFYVDFFYGYADEVTDNRIALSYCSSCKIMFEVGCVHAERGCTENVFNGHLISKWQDVITREIHTGTPQFESTEEWFSRARDVRVLDMVCINTMSNIGYCRCATYPQRKLSMSLYYVADKLSGCYLHRDYPVAALPPAEVAEKVDEVVVDKVTDEVDKVVDKVTDEVDKVVDKVTDEVTSTQLVVYGPLRDLPVRARLVDNSGYCVECVPVDPRPKFREKFTEYQLSCIIDNTKAYHYVIKYGPINALCMCGLICHDGAPREYRRYAADNPYRGPVCEN